MVGPSLVLPGCLGINTETYYIEGKKYSLTFFGIYGSSSHGSGRFVQLVELFNAKIRHDFDRSNNISLLN